MKQIKEFFKNKKVLVGTVAVILLATVGTVFALNQPQTKNEVAQQETISNEEHAKLMASIKSMQEADAQAKAKTEEEKKAAEQKAKQEAEAKAKEEAEKTQNEETQIGENTTTTTASSNTNSTSSNTAVASNNTTSVPSKPTTPAVAPKPQPKPAEPKPIENKPTERKRLGNLGNSGLEFKTYDEARNFGNKILNSTGEDWEEWNKKMGFEIFGWSGWTVDYSDGSQTWTIQWKP